MGKIDGSQRPIFLDLQVPYQRFGGVVRRLD
jgi:hypothetical protein